jgi:hypothetical protein
MGIFKSTKSNKQHITIAQMSGHPSIACEPPNTGRKKSERIFFPEYLGEKNQNGFFFPKYLAKEIRTDFLPRIPWQRKSERIFFPEYLGEKNQNGFLLPSKLLQKKKIIHHHTSFIIHYSLLTNKKN